MFKPEDTLTTMELKYHLGYENNCIATKYTSSRYSVVTVVSQLLQYTCNQVMVIIYNRYSISFWLTY